MTKPSIADILKYADLQMAAEAFLSIGGASDAPRTNILSALIAGNGHASTFTETHPCTPTCLSVRTAPVGTRRTQTPALRMATLAGSFSAPSSCWRRPASDPKRAVRIQDSLPRSRHCRHLLPWRRLKIRCCQCLCLQPTFFRQIDRFTPPMRIGDPALLVKCLHHCKVVSLPCSAVLKLERAEQCENMVLQFDVIVVHGIIIWQIKRCGKY